MQYMYMYEGRSTVSNNAIDWVWEEEVRVMMVNEIRIRDFLSIGLIYPCSV